MVLVSDNVPWCVDNLTHLAPQLEFVVNENRRDMFDDLAVLACAKRLILANSTFSYWGRLYCSGAGRAAGKHCGPRLPSGGACPPPVSCGVTRAGTLFTKLTAAGKTTRVD